MASKKKIGVIVRDRQGEALRMALGLTLYDDEVAVFVMDWPLGEADDIAVNLQGLRDMGASLFTNHKDNPLDFLETDEISRKLLDFDIVVAY